MIWLYFIYFILSLALLTAEANASNTEKKVFLKRTALISNIVASSFLLYFLIRSLIEAWSNTGKFFYGYSDEYITYATFLLILISMIFKKVRESAATGVVICIVLFFNFLIIMANFKVGIQ